MGVRTSLMNVVSVVSRWVAKIHLPFSRKAITSRDYLEVSKRIQPGDVILSTVNGELANLFIPGEWNHVALFCRSEDQSIVEALTAGVKVTYLPEFMFQKDRVAVVRPARVPPADRARAVEWALSMVGRPYDFEFDTSEKSLYCSELIAKAYMASFNGDFGVVMDLRFGSEIFYPQSFMDAVGNGWELVYRSDGE